MTESQLDLRPPDRRALLAARREAKIFSNLLTGVRLIEV